MFPMGTLTTTEQMADRIQFLRKKKFWMHGQSLTLDDFDRLYDHLQTSYVFPEMQEQGYIPILGSEEVDVQMNDDGTYSWAISVYGMYAPDSNLQYVTTEGYFQWNIQQAT